MPACLFSTFVFLSCSSGIQKTGEVSLEISSASLSRLAARDAASDAKADYTIKVKLTAESDTQEQTVNLANNKNTASISFSDLTIGETAKVEAWLYYGSNLISTGSSDSFTIKEGSNPVTIRLTVNGENIQFTFSDYSPVLFSITDDGYNYNITRNGNVIAANSNTNQFAFDSDENVFVVTSTGTTELTIVTDKPGCEGKNYSVSKEEMCNQYGIIIDPVTNDLYTYNFNSDYSDTQVKLYKYSEFTSSTEEEPSTEDPISFNCSEYFNGLNQWGYFIIRSLTVYDGIIYVYASGENNNYHTLAKYDGETLSKIFYSEDHIFPGYTEYGNFSDMIYQDGYIYILYKEKQVNPDDGETPNLISQGGIARIKVSDGTLERCGWAYDSNALVKFDFSQTSSDKFVLGQSWWDDGPHPTIIYEDETKSKPVVLDKNYFKAENFESWNDLLNMEQTQIVNDKKTDKSFCGPQRIIAVKPKKLVIADNGIAFYTAADGTWAYKNKNRMLVVDLDHFIIEGVKDVESDFSKKMEDVLLLSGSGYSTLENEVVEGYYFDVANSEWIQGPIPNSRASLAIPNNE